MTRVHFDSIVEVKDLIETYGIEVFVNDRTTAKGKVVVIDFIDDLELQSMDNTKTYQDSIQVSLMQRKDTGNLIQTELEFKQFMRSQFNCTSSISFDDDNEYSICIFDVNLIIKGLSNIANA